MKAAETGNNILPANQEDNGNGAAVRFSLPSVDISGRNLLAKDLNYFTKDQLEYLVLPLREILTAGDLRFTPESASQSCELMRTFVNPPLRYSFKKEEYIKLYMAFQSGYDNLHALARKDLRLFKCWKSIVMEPSIDSDEIKELSGLNPLVARRYGWNSASYVDCAFFPLSVVSADYHWEDGYPPKKHYCYYFSLKPAVRRNLAEMFLGKRTIEPRVVKGLPASEDLAICNFEDSMSDDLLFLEGLSTTMNPLSSTNGSLSASKLKAIKKVFATREFPTFGKVYPIDRIQMLAWAFFSLLPGSKKEKSVSDPGAFAKKVLKDITRYIYGPVFEMFFPSFKGFTQSWTNESRVDDMSRVTNNLIRPAADGWMSLSNLRIRFLCENTDRWSYKTHHDLFGSAIFKSKLRRKEEDPNVGKTIIVFEELDFTFLLRWIDFLCCLGMAEIAYVRDEDVARGDKLEGMRYVRLTALGRYAFGFDKTYTAPVAKEINHLEYDDPNRIVTVLTDNCPYTMFLGQISEPIGSTRYRITPASLLKGCVSGKDLEVRVANLKKVIPVDKYPGLKAVVEEAGKRTQCIWYDSEPYTVLTISPDVHDLIRRLSADKKIRENCIFAEKSRILVKKSFKPKFKEICLRFGYLADV